MSDLSEIDFSAISKAVRILNEAGLTVSKTNHVQKAGTGVEFKLVCEAPTKRNWFYPQLQAVQDAAMQAPEYGVDGEPIEEGDDER